MQVHQCTSALKSFPLVFGPTFAEAMVGKHWTLDMFPFGLWALGFGLSFPIPFTCHVVVTVIGDEDGSL